MIRSVNMSELKDGLSAYLRDVLLGIERGESVRAALSAASRMVASDLTTAEVARTLRRLTATGQLTPEQRTESYGLYMAAAAHWIFWGVDQGILSRAGEAFGVEPVRTIDAIHLATAAAFRAEVESVVVCSLEHRVRLNAKALGPKVLPADGGRNL